MESKGKWFADIKIQAMPWATLNKKEFENCLQRCVSSRKIINLRTDSNLISLFLNVFYKCHLSELNTMTL